MMAICVRQYRLRRDLFTTHEQQQLANYETTAPISESGNPGGGQVPQYNPLGKATLSGASHYWWEMNRGRSAGYS